MSGLGQLIVGIIFIIIFFGTLTIDTIPIIWTGALIVGVINVLAGLYNMGKSAISPQRNSTNLGFVSTCPQCGARNKREQDTCANCGAKL